MEKYWTLSSGSALCFLSDAFKRSGVGFTIGPSVINNATALHYCHLTNQLKPITDAVFILQHPATSAVCLSRAGEADLAAVRAGETKTGWMKSSHCAGRMVWAQIFHECAFHPELTIRSLFGLSLVWPGARRRPWHLQTGAVMETRPSSASPALSWALTLHRGTCCESWHGEKAKDFPSKLNFQPFLNIFSVSFTHGGFLKGTLHRCVLVLIL